MTMTMSYDQVWTTQSCSSACDSAQPAELMKPLGWVDPSRCLWLNIHTFFWKLKARLRYFWFLETNSLLGVTWQENAAAEQLWDWSLDRNWWKAVLQELTTKAASISWHKHQCSGLFWIIFLKSYTSRPKLASKRSRSAHKKNLKRDSGGQSSLICATAAFWQTLHQREVS